MGGVVEDPKEVVRSVAANLAVEAEVGGRTDTREIVDYNNTSSER